MAPCFTPAHHAALFAALCRALHAAFPREAPEACADAVRLYGEQRGRRMAMRTRLDGRTPDVENYLLYGEWSAQPGTSESAVTQLWPEVVMQCTRCPWHDLWGAEGCLPYGQIYCRDIDAALARAYGGMTLRTETCLTRGDDRCTFVFSGCGVPPERQAAMQAHAQALGDRARMPWGYHCAHLYSAFLAVSGRLGARGADACGDGLRAFSAQYGQEYGGYILAHSGEDFDSLPTGR